MEWLWLCLAVVGLGLLWLLIIGIEKLTQRLKENDEARRRANKRVAERTAAAEADFMEQEYEKAVTKAAAQDFIANGDFGDTKNPENAAILQEAINTLSTEEFIQSVAKRMMGEPQGTDSIAATKSAFERTPVHKVVAKGDGVIPVKAKASNAKSSLSKAEQKMLKKIKQGD